MPPLATAKRHFDEDIQRATELSTHAAQMHIGRLSGDVLRAAWMMAVGSCDAYFSDAYGDLVSRVLRAKDLQQRVKIPDRLGNLKIPAIAMTGQSRGGWRWRMAARELIEEESVLSIEKIRNLFNQFCDEQNKLLNQESIEGFITHAQAIKRLLGISSAEYSRLGHADKSAARKRAVGTLENRFEDIFQRRHDCIHNCDRPKLALQGITCQAVDNTIEDITFLVSRCHEILKQQFPSYLSRLGFSGQTRNRVCM